MSIAIFPLVLLAGFVLGSLALLGLILANKQTRLLGIVLVGFGVTVVLIFGAYIGAARVAHVKQARHVAAENDAVARTATRRAADEAFDKLTEPRIELDAEVDGDAVFDPAHGVASKAVLSPEEARPKWVDDPPTINNFPGAAFVTTLASSPHIAPSEGVVEERIRLADAALRFVRDSLPQGSPDASLTSAGPGISTNELFRRFVKDRYLEARETSITPVYTLHTLVVIDEEGGRELIERTLAAGRSERFTMVGLTAGGVLIALAAVLGVLKLDEATRGYYTKRLLVGVPLVIIGLVVVVFLARASALQNSGWSAYPPHSSTSHGGSLQL